jgi:hypothetical protein
MDYKYDRHKEGDSLAEAILVRGGMVFFEKLIPVAAVTLPVVTLVAGVAVKLGWYDPSQGKHVASPPNQTIVLKDCPSSQACVEKEVTTTEEQLAEIMSSAHKIFITIER